MCFLMGLAGTGKSTIIEVIAAMFSKRAIAEIDGNHEKVFGLHSKSDKELILIRDAPKTLSVVLPQEHFQKMISGEAIQISVKFKTAFASDWTVPMIGASNHPLDYNDNQGQISRRVVMFKFEKMLSAAGKKQWFILYSGWEMF